MIVLQSKNLTLSPCSARDRADFIALELDPEVMHFLNGGAVDHATTDPKQVTFLMPRGTEPYVWTARLTDNGAFVGWFCLYPDSEACAEIGYRLRRDQWGQGFAFEGAERLVDWGFGSAGYDRIVACTMALNKASRRVMEKLGMAHTHTDFATPSGPVANTEGDQVWYELTLSHWSGRRAG